MDTLLYVDQENGRLTTPAIKSRQRRLHSAPDQCMRTPLTGKAPLCTPLQSNRTALGAVNKILPTSETSKKAEEKTRPAETKGQKALGLNLKHLKLIRRLTEVLRVWNDTRCSAPSPSDAEYPEIEKFFPYNPSEFETYSVPDEVCLSHISLAGLAKQPWPPAPPVEQLIMLDPCLPFSPFKMPKDTEYIDEMKAFLQTIDELTIDMPPEPEF